MPALVRHGRRGIRDSQGPRTRRHPGWLVERHRQPGRVVAGLERSAGARPLARVTRSAGGAPRRQTRTFQTLPVAQFGSPEQAEFRTGTRAPRLPRRDNRAFPRTDRRPPAASSPSDADRDAPRPATVKATRRVSITRACGRIWRLSCRLRQRQRRSRAAPVRDGDPAVEYWPMWP